MGNSVIYYYSVVVFLLSTWLLFLSCMVHNVFTAVLQYHNALFNVGVIIAINIYFVCFHSLCCFPIFIFLLFTCKNAQN